jgi:hypothetical protein
MISDKIRELVVAERVHYKGGVLKQEGSRKEYSITPWLTYVPEFNGLTEGQLRIQIIEEVEIMTSERKDSGFGMANYDLPTAENTLSFIEQACGQFNVNIGVMDTGGAPGFTQFDDETSVEKAIPFKDVCTMVKRYITEYEEDTIINGPEDKELRRHVFNVGRVLAYLEDLPREYNSKAESTVRKNVLYNEAYKDYPLSYIGQYLQAMQAEGDIRLNAVVVLHWMWQVKRFLFGYKVIDPIFLNLFGAGQGIGKSYFVNILKRAFNGFHRGANLSEVLDDRTYSSWARMYIMHFEELAKGKLENNQIGDVVAALKRVLTDTHVTYRELGSHQHPVLLRTASAIASANHSIIKVLPDDTGMRRFFEIAFKATKVDKPFEVLQGWESSEHSEHILTGLWAGIDEKADSPLDLYGMRQAMYDVQAEYKGESCIEQYLHYAEDPEEPILSDDPAAESITKHFESSRQVKADDIANYAAQIGITAVKIGTWRENITDWYKQTGQSTQYVTKVGNMSQLLESTGYFVLKINRMQFVFINI